MEDRNIIAYESLKTTAYDLRPVDVAFVDRARRTIDDILHDKDDRILAVVGPCSVHTIDGFLEYASKLKTSVDSYNTRDDCIQPVFLVIRCYLQKPRSGRPGSSLWPGYLFDPDGDGTFDISKGLRESTRLMVELTRRRIPIATEFVDSVSIQFLSRLVSYAVIGARTSESQLHRQVASGLSAVVGVKNSSSGDVVVAVNACRAIRRKSAFIGVDATMSDLAVVRTGGNERTSVILRGSYDTGENYSDILRNRRYATQEPILVDCNHGNSSKTIEGAIACFEFCIRHLRSRLYKGFMLESFLDEGTSKDMTQTTVSITDPCVSLGTTVDLLRKLMLYNK